VGAEVCANHAKDHGVLLCSALAASLIAAFAISAGTSAQNTYSHETQEQPRSSEEPKESQKAEAQDTVAASLDTSPAQDGSTRSA
jgi:hypothetical protein